MTWSRGDRSGKVDLRYTVVLCAWWAHEWATLVSACSSRSAITLQFESFRVRHCANYERSVWSSFSLQQNMQQDFSLLCFRAGRHRTMKREEGDGTSTLRLHRRRRLRHSNFGCYTAPGCGDQLQHSQLRQLLMAACLHQAGCYGALSLTPSVSNAKAAVDHLIRRGESSMQHATGQSAVHTAPRPRNNNPSPLSDHECLMYYELLYH